MKQKEYLIGDVAGIIGVSRDTLRLYEKKGLISVRKKENGYRYYIEEDIFKLSSIFYQRKMNINLEEIERLWVGNTSYLNHAETAEQKIQQEEAEILRHQQALLRLRVFRNECRKIREHINRFFIRTFQIILCIECRMAYLRIIWKFISPVHIFKRPSDESDCPVPVVVILFHIHYQSQYHFYPYYSTYPLHLLYSSCFFESFRKY